MDRVKYKPSFIPYSAWIFMIQEIKHTLYFIVPTYININSKNVFLIFFKIL